jgi:hypothetical protein
MRCGVCSWPSAVSRLDRMPSTSFETIDNKGCWSGFPLDGRDVKVRTKEVPDLCHRAVATCFALVRVELGAGGFRLWQVVAGEKSSVPVRPTKSSSCATRTSDSESPERQAAMTAVPKRSMQRWESGLDPRNRTGVNAGWTGGQSFRQSSRCGRHQPRPISGRRKESEAHVRSASGTRRHGSGPVGSGVARSRVLV